MMNYAQLSHSPRLQRVHELLRQGGEHSTLEICIRAEVCAVSAIVAEVCAVSAIVAELRAQGADIRCRQIHSKETGGRIWLYQLVTPVREASTP